MARPSAPALVLTAALLACGAASAASPTLVKAAGRWAAVRDGSRCEAASLALLVARAGQVPARLSVASSPTLEVAVRLRRAVPPQSTVMLEAGGQAFLLRPRGDMAWSRGPEQAGAMIAAFRRGGAVRVRARGADGARFDETFLLDGAPTAIDAAAACSIALAKRDKSR